VIWFVVGMVVGIVAGVALGGFSVAAYLTQYVPRSSLNDRDEGE